MRCRASMRFADDRLTTPRRLRDESEEEGDLTDLTAGFKIQQDWLKTVLAIAQGCGFNDFNVGLLDGLCERS